jgi:1-aminocyclopropane-1-carboxylate deaminase
MSMFEKIAQNIPDQQINFHDITLTIRRLDLVHPQISGNKFFKLKYNFLEAKRQDYQHIRSFGGAYSCLLYTSPSPRD